jgi:hypothetical protein
VLHIRTPRVATSRFPCCYSFDIHVDNLIYLLSARIASGEIFTHIFLFFFWYTYNMLQWTSARCLCLTHISIAYCLAVWHGWVPVVRVRADAAEHKR